nr:GNAT family N-acetyltransferase [Oryzicola mucosus]
MTEIRTPRLKLRHARETDLEPLHLLLSDARAMAYWSTEPHASLDMTREWLGRMIDIEPDEGEDFIVEHDGRVIGKAGLYRFPEIGYLFHPDVWGQGFATEALRSILDRAFTVHRLPSVIADVDPRNTASLALLARLGFGETGRAERTFEIAGRWVDSVYLKLDNAACSTPSGPTATVCDECGSQFLSSSSKMASLCPDCSHHLYGYDNCEHMFVRDHCIRCGWDGSRSKYLAKLIGAKPEKP